jgi:hypothetical protein
VQLAYPILHCALIIASFGFYMEAMHRTFVLL